ESSIANGSPARANGFISYDRPIVSAHSPNSPSIGSEGPVIPFEARTAAATPCRAAFAPAQAFHIDISPMRVRYEHRFGMIASDMASQSSDFESFSSLPHATATPRTPAIG